MDDYTSRQQIDELADLYLTTPGEDGDTPTPSPVEGPAPIKLAPKLGGEAASTTPDNPDTPMIESTIDESDDSHPVLRLTEDTNQTDRSEEDVPTMSEDSAAATLEPPTTPTNDTTNEPAPRAVLEAVLLGNLPGMSGPWLTQYAQLLAQTEGPVALLHVGEEAIDLELVEPRAEAEPAPASPPATVRIPPMRGNRTGIVGLIDALVRSEHAPTRTILVRIDAATDPQTLSRLAAMDDWTLLCGSDDTSIAGASQQLRAVVHADPRLADRNIGVMVMGSDENASRESANRIADNLEHDLANPVELIGHLKRMQPVQVRDLGSFPDPVGLWPKLVSWFDTLELPEPMPTPEPAPPPKPEALAPTQAAPQPTRQAPPASRPDPAPMFRKAPPAPAAPKPRQTAAAATPKPTPKPAVVREPMRPAPQPRVLTPQPELDLVALLAQGPAALDQPVALDARIPDQPNTQLAVDAQGVVHILAQHESDQADARQAVMQLIEAGQWINDHLELIALTQRDQLFVEADPVLHLMTDRADLTAQLVGKLAGQVKLHLLQQVTLGRESGWFCTPLG